MTTEEKLQHFMEVSVNTAAMESQRMIDEYKAGMDKIFEEHKSQALKDADTLKKTVMDGLIRNSSKDFSMQQQHIKRKLTHKQEELREKLFAEVVTALNAYKQTKEYDDLLVKQIKGALAIAKDEEVNIYIDPEDADKLETLKSATKAEISINEFSFMGGMKAAIPSKNILIDNSFESKFTDAKEAFIITV